MGGMTSPFTKHLRMLLPELLLDDVDMQHYWGTPVLAFTVTATDQLHAADDHRALLEMLWQLIVVYAKLGEQYFVLEVCQCALHHNLRLGWSLACLIPQSPVACIVLIVDVGVNLHRACPELH